MLGIIIYIRFLDSKKLFKFIISLFCSVYFGFKFNLSLNFQKCPECYNTDFCCFFQNQQVQLTWLSFFLSVINPNLTKSVFHGVLNGSEAIVIKKKARKINKFQNELGVLNVLNEVKLNAQKVQNVILCPEFKDLDFLLNHINDGFINKRLWINLKISIEPLLLLHFQSLGNWPFPKYKGACGDIIVEEYKGEPLNKFIASEFKVRAFLANHILKMAHLFTFGHPDFIFYFTDYSLENLVVDLTGNISLIDLDNIIIFNKTSDKVLHSLHTSEILDGNKYAFSPSDICNHYLSDHNYFSVCKYLLGNPDDGLLKEIPQTKEKIYSELLLLLNECIEPKKIKSRISSGQRLQILLEKLTKNYIWKV